MLSVILSSLVSCCIEYVVMITTANTLAPSRPLIHRQTGFMVQADMFEPPCKQSNREVINNSQNSLWKTVDNGGNLHRRWWSAYVYKNNCPHYKAWLPSQLSVSFCLSRGWPILWLLRGRKRMRNVSLTFETSECPGPRPGWKGNEGGIQSNGWVFLWSGVFLEI